MSRYKQERVWDRQMQTLADLIDGLNEMSRVDFMRWEAADRIGRDANPDESLSEDEIEDALTRISENAEWEKRYAEARRRVDSAAAMAKLLLNDEINKAVDEWMDTMDASLQEYRNEDEPNYLLFMARDVKASEDCIATLIQMGRGMANLRA